MTRSSLESAMRGLRAQARPENVEGMARYGISVQGTLGVPMPAIRSLAKKIDKDQELAVQLWSSGVHEARILAGLVADPRLTDRALMERWVKDFDSWDVCDQVCSNLFDRTAHAYDVIPDWVRRDEEFVRRAGFVMMAALAVHDKEAPDERFLAFLPMIDAGSTDARNYVRKAVNWALRQIGKRDRRLHHACLEMAEAISRKGDTSSSWIAADALRELRSEPVLRRLDQREGRARARRSKEIRR